MDKARSKYLDKRWRDVVKALEDLHDLHILPPGMDRAEAEGTLLEELDRLEYEAGLEYLESRPAV